MTEQPAHTDKTTDDVQPTEEGTPTMLDDETLDAAAGGARPSATRKGIIIIGG